ncbi:MAG: hypothetical protein ACW98X_17830 [Promethearchaeota archaeon]|jgi:uncharacterized Zn finger protein (UPF0148 family)
MSIDEILRSMKCPECAAPIKFEGKSIVQCAFCDSTVQMIEGLDNSRAEELEGIIEAKEEILEQYKDRIEQLQSTIKSYEQRTEIIEHTTTKPKPKPKRAISSMGATLRALPIAITEKSAGVTIRSNQPHINSEIFSYQVPLGMHTVFRESDEFYMMLYDDSTTPVRVHKGTYEIRKTDALGHITEVVAQGSIREFTGTPYESRVPRFPMDVAIRQSSKLEVYVNSEHPISYDANEFMFKGVQLVERF